MFGFIEVFGKKFIIGGTRAKYVGREIRVTGHGMDMHVRDSRWDSAYGDFGGFNVDQIRRIANEAIRTDREHCNSN